jgi:hypothetical protein
VKVRLSSAQRQSQTRQKAETEKLIALIEATVLEIYSVDNKLSGYIQWRCLEKEF